MYFNFDFLFSYFDSGCYSRQWGCGVNPIFHIVVFVFGVNHDIIRRQGESKIPICNLIDRKFLLGPATYNKLLERIAFSVLWNIHDWDLLQKLRKSLRGWQFLQKRPTDVWPDSKCTSDCKETVSKEHWLLVIVATRIFDYSWFLV